MCASFFFQKSLVSTICLCFIQKCVFKHCNNISLFLSSDRPGLRNLDLVQKINKKLEEVLQKTIAASHATENAAGLFQELKKKIPDLRTLNTLHSEKLLGRSFNSNIEAGQHSTPAVSTTTNIRMDNNAHHHQQQQPDSQSDNNSPDRWSNGSSSDRSLLALGLGHYSPTSTDDGPRSVSPPTTGGSAWGDSKEGGFGSPRSMSSSSGVSSDTDGMLSRKGSISLPSSTASGATTKLAYIGGNFATSNLTSSDSQNLLTHSRVHSPATTTASICSSPSRSSSAAAKESLEDESIDDMPVLKRALQAPPLVNTNKLMDEAYRNHKKFRAATRARGDYEPHSPSTTTSTKEQLTTATTFPATLASSHSTLLKTLEQPSRYMNEQQLKRTDLIHNIIMSSESLPSSAAGLCPWKSESAAPTTVLYSSPNGGYYQLPNTATSTPSSLVCPYTGHTATSNNSTILSSNTNNQQAPSICIPSAYHAAAYAKGALSPSAAAAATSLLVMGSSMPPLTSSPIAGTGNSVSLLTSVAAAAAARAAASTTDKNNSSQQAAAHPLLQQQLSSPTLVQSPPYSHLQRCLTATTAPIMAAPGLPPKTATLRTTMDDDDDDDEQPLNLSTKPSSPPTAPVKMETD